MVKRNYIDIKDNSEKFRQFRIKQILAENAKVEARNKNQKMSEHSRNLNDSYGNTKHPAYKHLIEQRLGQLSKSETLARENISKHHKERKEQSVKIEKDYEDILAQLELLKDKAKSVVDPYMFITDISKTKTKLYTDMYAFGKEKLDEIRKNIKSLNKLVKEYYEIDDDNEIEVRRYESIRNIGKEMKKVLDKFIKELPVLNSNIEKKEFVKTYISNLKEGRETLYKPIVPPQIQAINLDAGNESEDEDNLINIVPHHHHLPVANPEHQHNAQPVDLNNQVPRGMPQRLDRNYVRENNEARRIQQRRERIVREMADEARRQEHARRQQQAQAVLELLQRMQLQQARVEERAEENAEDAVPAVAVRGNVVGEADNIADDGGVIAENAEAIIVRPPQIGIQNDAELQAEDFGFRAEDFGVAPHVWDARDEPAPNGANPGAGGPIQEDEDEDDEEKLEEDRGDLVDIRVKYGTKTSEVVAIPIEEQDIEDVRYEPLKNAIKSVIPKNIANLSQLVQKIFTRTIYIIYHNEDNDIVEAQQVVYELPRHFTIYVIFKDEHRELELPLFPSNLSTENNEFKPFWREMRDLSGKRGISEKIKKEFLQNAYKTDSFEYTLV